jgi:hypothetical protein
MPVDGEAGCLITVRRCTKAAHRRKKPRCGEQHENARSCSAGIFNLHFLFLLQIIFA